MNITVSGSAGAPHASQIDVHVHISATMNVTAFVARRKVNGLLLDRVGTGLYTDKPELVMSDQRMCWRVPVILALPTLGRLGQVGTVEVDVQSGEVLADEITWQEMSEHAERLVAGATLQTE